MDAANKVIYSFGTSFKRDFSAFEDVFIISIIKNNFINQTIKESNHLYS